MYTVLKVFILTTMLVVSLMGCGQDQPRFYNQAKICTANQACICSVLPGGAESIIFCKE